MERRGNVESGLGKNRKFSHFCKLSMSVTRPEGREINCYFSFFRSDGEKCFTFIVLIYLFIMFAELFISSHLPFICLLALKSLTKCAKKFPERNPNNPFLIKYTSSEQSPSVSALTILQCCLESSAVFSLLQKSVFPFLCKIILKMNQFRKTDEMEGILHRGRSI